MEAKPAYQEGDRINEAVILEVVGRRPRDTSANNRKKLWFYLARCGCNAVFEIDQDKIGYHKRHDTKITCRDCYVRAMKCRKTNHDYDPKLFATWGYNPKESVYDVQV